MSSSSSSVSTYDFHAMGRIGLDAVDQSQTSLQNTKFSNYMLSNFFENNTSYADFALKQPNVYFNGRAVDGRAVDIESMLYFDGAAAGAAAGAGAASVGLVNERMFLSLPYLGRGSCNPDMETRLKIGEFTAQRKSASELSESTFYDPNTYPMMDSIRSTVTDPRFIMQETAMPGWQRGGTSTRE